MSITVLGYLRTVSKVFVYPLKYLKTEKIICGCNHALYNRWLTTFVDLVLNNTAFELFINMSTSSIFTACGDNGSRRTIRVILGVENGTLQFGGTSGHQPELYQK